MNKARVCNDLMRAIIHYGDMRGDGNEYDNKAEINKAMAAVMDLIEQLVGTVKRKNVPPVPTKA